MRAQFGMTWLMEKAFMWPNRGWSGLSIHAYSDIYIYISSVCSDVKYIRSIYHADLPIGMKVNGFGTTWRVMGLLKLRYLIWNLFQVPSMLSSHCFLFLLSFKSATTIFLVN